MGKFDFSKVGGADMSKKGVPLTPNSRVVGQDANGKPIHETYAANYELKVVRCIAIASRKKKDLFIVETEVMASDNPANPVGSKRNWVQDVNNDAGPGALKGFACACLGFDHKDDNDAAQIKALEDKFQAIMTEALEDKTDPDCKNGFAGSIIKCEVREINTKPKAEGGAPGKFNLHTFSPKK